MFFKSKKTLEIIQLYHNSQLLYEGELKDLPLKESVVLAKSLEFFNDPEPCYIHRGAVRIRLTEEILRELQKQSDITNCPLLISYADFPVIDSFSFTLEQH